MNYKEILFSFKIITLFFLFFSNSCITKELPQTLENPPFLFFYSDPPSSRILTSILFNELDQKYAVIISISDHKVIYSLENELFMKIQTGKGDFYLVNGFPPGFECKNSVIPLVYDEFFIKLIQIFGKVNAKVIITDLFRTEEQQTLYYKRHWTNTFISPHMIGQAVDFKNLNFAPESQLKSLAATLGISFLKHGRKNNKHMHLQDNISWGRIKGMDVLEISKKIMQDYTGNYLSYNTLPQKVTEQRKFNFSEINFDFEKPGILTIEIFRVDGFKIAIIKSGVYESGSHRVRLYYDFLPSGVYLGKLYINGLFYNEVIIKAI
jgi:hypothetical protein